MPKKSPEGQVPTKLSGRHLGNLNLFILSLLFPIRNAIALNIRLIFALIVTVLQANYNLKRMKFSINLISIGQIDIDPSSSGGENRSVWISKNILSILQIADGQWVSISTGGTDSKYAFPCKVFQLEESSKGSSNQSIYFNETTLFNFLRSLGLPPWESSTSLKVQVIPLFTSPLTNQLSTSPISEKLENACNPKKALVVKLQRIGGPDVILMDDKNSKIVDLVLKDYFEKPQCLVVGDVININTNPNGNAGRGMTFSVQEVDGLSFNENKISQHYLVSCEWSSLVLSGTPMQNFHIPMRTLPNHSYDILPPSLSPLCNNLIKILISSLSQMNERSQSKTCRKLPISTSPPSLIYGQKGTGKFTLAEATAFRLGLNFYSTNAVSFVGDTSAYTEAKLKALGDRAKAIAPAIIYIRNIHLLGKDKEGHDDKRVVIAFQEILGEIPDKKSTEFPVFIIGSTSKPGDIIGTLRDHFLHKLETPSSIPKSEIAETLRWLMAKLEDGTNGTKIKVSDWLDHWVEKSCHGVTRNLADLQFILSFAIREWYNDSVDKIETKNAKGRTRRSGFYPNAKIDRFLTESQLDKALAELDNSLKDSCNSYASKIPNVTWDDIGGLTDIKSELISSIQLPLQFPKLFSSGIKRSGILLYGPPGTGKTLIAKAVATEFKLSFLSVKGPELLNMYVGQSEQNVREVFARAKESAPSVLFFDELDSLAPNRGKSGDSGGVMDRVVSQILAELDGSHSTPGVFIIAATNRPDLIDPALLRPGRFDKLLYVGINEDTLNKKRILEALTRKFPLGASVDLGCIASKLPSGMTGADLFALCSDAYMTAVSSHINRIEKAAAISGDDEKNIQRLKGIRDLEENDGEDEIENPENNADFMDSTEEVKVEHEDFLQAVERAIPSLSLLEQRKYDQLRQLINKS